MMNAGVTTDAGMETEPEAEMEAGAEAGMSAGAEAGMSAGIEADMNAGTEAGMNAGTEAGTETGMNAGDEMTQSSPRQLCEESCAACNLACEEKISTTFDGGYFITAALGQYFASKGKVLNLDKCNGYRSCEDSVTELPMKRTNPDQAE